MRDDGILTFYELKNTAAAGSMPVLQLVACGTAYYGRQYVGVTRLYAARGANASVDVLARCYNTPEVPMASDGAHAAQYVILEDGRQYRIDAVQEQTDLDAVDLTLVRLEEKFDVADPEPEPEPNPDPAPTPEDGEDGDGE